MKLGDFDYKVSRQVSFTKQEIEVLLKMARGHYDSVCQEAAMFAGLGPIGCKNGFLAQVTLFKGPHVWTFREFDLTAKILEQRHYSTYAKYENLAGKLSVQMNEAMNSINQEYARLMKASGY